MLERALASKVRALVSGSSMPASLASYDLASSSWRTSQLCLDGAWERFSGAFPRSGMMRSGTVAPLPPSAPLTGATGCGSWPSEATWPTPAASVTNLTEDPASFEARRQRLKAKGINGNGAGVPLTVAVKMLPTPTAKANMMAPSMQKWATHRNLLPTPTSSLGTAGGRVTPRKGRNGLTLIEAVAKEMFAEGRPSANGTPGHATSVGRERNLTGSTEMFPTPTAHLGHRRSCPSPEHAARRYAEGRRNLEDAAALSFRTPTVGETKAARNGSQNQTMLSHQVGGSLNPTWVEWLMGFPLGWTSSALWETRSSRKSRKSSAAP